jgi:tetratricopeptide (TPR) repeat protein
VRLVERPDVHLAVAFAMSHALARDAEPLLEEAARRANADGDAAGAALSRVLAAQMRLWTGEGSADEAEELGRVALPLLEALQDHAGLADLWYALANGVYNYAGRHEQMVQAAEKAHSFETLVGRPHQRSDALCANALLYGPRPVDEAMQHLDALDSNFTIDLMRAVLLAMSDRIDEARVLARAAEQRARELGRHADEDIAEIDSLSGDHDAAAERLVRWCGVLVDRGWAAGVTASLGLLGRELCLAGRYEEAEQFVVRARERNDDGSAFRSLWRQAAALVSAHRGEYIEAERLAREALTHVQKTDSPWLQADAYCDLAEVLEVAGRRCEAVAAWQEALDRYERKQIIPLAHRVRDRLSALTKTSG